MWLPEHKRWLICTETHTKKNITLERHYKKQIFHICAYKYSCTWKSPVHIHANTVTHILRISGVPLGHALGRNHTHNTVAVFLPPGALIGSGVADSLGRLRISSLNHDGNGLRSVNVFFVCFFTRCLNTETTLTFTIWTYTTKNSCILVLKPVLYTVVDQGQAGNPRCVRSLGYSEQSPFVFFYFFFTNGSKILKSDFHIDIFTLLSIS